MGCFAVFAFVMCIGAINVSAQTSFKNVGFNESVKIKGVIASRSGDSLTMREVSGTDMYNVDLLPSTKVQTYKKVVRGGDQFATSYLLRGLRIQVTGTGNANGQPFMLGFSWSYLFCWSANGISKI